MNNYCQEAVTYATNKGHTRLGLAPKQEQVPEDWLPKCKEEMAKLGWYYKGPLSKQHTVIHIFVRGE